MSRKSEFSPLSLLCVVVLLAAAMSFAQTAPSQDADPNAAQPVTESGAAAIAPSGPLMASSKAQRREDKLAARSQFLAQWKQRSAGFARHKKKASPAFGGTWQLGTIVTSNDPICNPLLLTDGTVIFSDCGTLGQWNKLTPDITGSYVNGTWSQIATMPVFNNFNPDPQYAPLYFASAVLPDGRVIAMGGEFNYGHYFGLPVGAIYDPVANTWTPVSAPAGAGWVQEPLAIGDAESTVLADGTFLLAACCATDPDLDALFDATNLTWTSTGAPNAGDGIQDEQGYTLLPNGNVLTVDISTGCSGGSCNGPNPTNAEQYNPSTGTWSSAGNTVVSLVDPYACANYEIGPAPLRPDGTVVQFGGNTGCTGEADPTGIYDSTTGVWSAGPNVPEVCGSNGTTQCNLADAPAAVLPNGNILFGAETGYGKAPSHFFEFTTLNAINQVADDAGASFVAAFNYNFLVLPNGQILATIEKVDQPEFYTPTGSPDPSWAPVISTSPSNVYPGTTYTISGTQLNGLTQGAYYGDDVQGATNYPIVQITNSATGHVFYGRTFNVSNRSVAPGAAVSTNFTVPANIEKGASSLVVIANGIPSTPVPVGIAVPVPSVSVGSSLNPSLYGQAVSFTATVTGVSPTGTVQFNIDGSAFGSPVTLASGAATSGTTSTLAAGTHTVTAVYSGDTNNAEGTGTLVGGQVVHGTTTVTLTPASLAFGNVVEDATSAAKSVKLKNTGSTTLNISSIAVSGDFASATSTSPCGSTLAAGKTCTIEVTFTPKALGALSGSITLADSASGSPQTVPLTGTGTVQATLTPASATYAAQTVNTTSAAKVFTLTNKQSVALTSIAISTIGDFSVSTTTCTASLAAKGSCKISVVFKPAATGTLTGSLNVADSASGSPQTSSLKGTGKAAK